MPRVPSYQPNQVGPVQTTDARLRPADYSQGVVGSIGKGLQLAGQSVANYADDMDRIAQIADDSESRARTLQLQTQASEVMAEAMSARGLDARSAFARAQERLEKLRHETMSSVSSKRAREMFRERSDAVLAGYHGQLVEHSAREVRGAAEDTFKAEATGRTTATSRPPRTRWCGSIGGRWRQSGLTSRPNVSKNDDGLGLLLRAN